MTGPGTAGRNRVGKTGPRHPLLPVVGNRALLFLWLISGLTGCREPAPVADSGARPDQVIEGFTMHETASGERLYTLEADTAGVFERDGHVNVARPRVSFYTEAGAIHAVLVAHSGILGSRTGDLVAYGNIEVRTSDSTLLRTDSLYWDNAVRLVRTDAPVAILTPRGELFGHGLIADAGLTRVEIQSEVTGKSDYRFEPEQSEREEE